MIVWWLLMTGTFWVASKVFDQSASLLFCAGSAAVFVAVGEAGDWVRRRRAAARRPLPQP